MRRRAVMRIPGIALFLIVPLLLIGCPKRPDVAGTTPHAPGTPGEAAPPSATRPGPDAPSAADPSSPYTATVRTQEEPVSPPAAVQEPPVAGAPTAAPKHVTEAVAPLKDIFFDFDKSTIRDDATPNLLENVEWLKAHATARITIEGHCDERGTAEYNLGLGERRAKAALDYLVAAGIDPKRIRTISYGKERPFVLGHDESAWKWNRRAHFVIVEPAKP
jgi:peptidoglycan-associated lipoprotein